METIIGLIVMILIYVIIKAVNDARFNNCDMSNISVGKMMMDRDKSTFEIRRNCANGKYNRDSQWKL